MPAALFLSALLLQAALPEGNALVRELVGAQRHREELLNQFTYDLTEVEEDLQADGRVKKRESRRYQVFYVKGRPVRMLVARDDSPLPAAERAREEQRARQKADDVSSGRTVSEQPQVRLSAILERFDFRTVRREEVGGRPAWVLEFVPRPGKRELKHDNVLRTLTGFLWVDEADREVARAELRNTQGIKFGLGLGASVSRIDLLLSFTKAEDAVWLPARVQSFAEGRLLLFKKFRKRTTATYENYRRFQVESQEDVTPP